MIKHIVCFNLLDPTEENCKKAAEVLLSMKDKIDVLRGIEVGVDFLRSERSCDVVLETLFDSKEDLGTYQDHPYHVETVKKYMHKVRKSSISADYEI